MRMTVSIRTFAPRLFLLLILGLVSVSTCSPVSAHVGPSNLTFLTSFPTTYIINQAANTRWVADQVNRNVMNVYLMDYTGLQVRQHICVDVPYDTTNNCTWWPDGTLYPNNNYKLMVNQTDSGNYTVGEVTILAAGTTALYTGEPAPTSTAMATSTTTGASVVTVTPGADSESQAPLPSQHQILHSGAIAGIAIGSAAGAAIIALIAFLIYRRKQRTTRQGAKLTEDSPPSSPASGTIGHGGYAPSPISSDGSATLGGRESSEGTLDGRGKGGDPAELGSDVKLPVEVPSYERPAELMDPGSQPVVEKDGNMVYELSSHRRFSYEA